MADVAPGIITFGLGGNHTNMIVGFPFNLGFLEVIVPPVPPEKPTRRPGGAGVAPPDRTKPYDEDTPRSIIVRVTLKEKTIEKVYVVPAKRAEIVIRAMNFINKTRKRVKVTVSNMKRRTANILATIKNITNKNDDE